MKVRGYGRNCRMVFYVTQEWRDGLVALAQDEGISTSDLLPPPGGKKCHCC